MQTSVECPVCFDVYAPRIRPPKLLITCGHGVCEQCVQSLLAKIGGSSIVCPVCRTKCELPEGKSEKLPTNYQILDLIDSLCGECRGRPHTQRCGHCPINLCDVCREAHLRGVSSNLMDRAKELEQLVADISLKLADRGDVQVIKEKGTHFKTDMKKALEEQILQLRAGYEKKITEVDAEINRHIDMVMEWRRDSRQLCADCDALLDMFRYMDQSIGQGETANSDQEQTQQEDLNEKINALKHMLCSKPDASKVQIEPKENQLILAKEFVSHETQTDVGLSPRFTSQHTQNESTDGMLPQIGGVKPAAHDLVPDYSAAVSKATCYNVMSQPCAVCEDPTTGKLFITDPDRSKVYMLTSGLHLIEAKGGPKGQHKRRYFYPFGVVTDGRCLFVSDKDNSRVVVTDLQGAKLHTIGSQGSGREQFNFPYGLSIDSCSRYLYICDTGNKRIKVVDTQGAYIREFGRDVFLGIPLYNAISSDNILAVTTNTGCHIYLFTTEGKHIKTINVPPLNIGATSVTFDVHGHLLVSDDIGGRVAVMKMSGDVVGFIGSPGSGPGQLKCPRGLIVTRDGNVVVCDMRNSKVELFGIPKMAAKSAK